VQKGQPFPPFLLCFSLLGDDRNEMSACDYLFRGFGRLRSIRTVQREVGEDEQALSYDFHFFVQEFGGLTLDLHHIERDMSHNCTFLKSSIRKAFHWNIQRKPCTKIIAM
jgi:hypothetical protein